MGRLGPHVVGLRVVVRRVLPGETGPTGGPAMTDVLGICESWEHGIATVRKEDGSVVEIATADIVSGKPVPPRPSVHRRLDAAEADRLALPGWQPVESEPLGEWLLRASGGFSSRGNSVLALGDPGMPGARRWPGFPSGTPPAPCRPRPCPPGRARGAAFAEAGWTAYEPTLLMLASVAKVLRNLGPQQAPSPGTTRWSTTGWLASDERAARYGEPARAVLEAGEVTFATVRDDQGAVLARGRGAFHGDWVGVSSLWTDPAHRGTGLGSAVLGSLLAWGAERVRPRRTFRWSSPTSTPACSTRRAATSCTTATPT